MTDTHTDIIPHRALMKQGFDTGNGERTDVETAFKSPKHPFRVAIVCAMWLTGFDVECLSTLYIDKPMKAHNSALSTSPSGPGVGDGKFQLSALFRHLRFSSEVDPLRIYWTQAPPMRNEIQDCMIPVA